MWKARLLVIAVLHSLQICKYFATNIFILSVNSNSVLFGQPFLFRWVSRPLFGRKPSNTSKYRKERNIMQTHSWCKHLWPVHRHWQRQMVQGVGTWRYSSTKNGWGVCTNVSLWNRLSNISSKWYFCSLSILLENIPYG